MGVDRGQAGSVNKSAQSGPFSSGGMSGEGIKKAQREKVMKDSSHNITAG
jgi:hypothetical protein